LAERGAVLPLRFPKTGLLTGGSQAPKAHGPQAFAVTSFDRKELNTILNLYGRKVAAGEWRDYALDFLRERAVFSVFARASERPLYMIEKTPKLRAKQGQYMVSGQDGRILKRGHELTTVLRALEPKLALVE